MQLGIKKLYEDSVIPVYAHDTDSGMDLIAHNYKFFDDGELITQHLIKGIEIELRPQESIFFGSGISIQLPPNTEAQIRGRSGLAAKKQLSITHGVGTIDEGYCSELGILLTNHGEESVFISKGDRVAQMVICPVLRPAIVEVENLELSSRGEGGFGSTGI